MIYLAPMAWSVFRQSQLKEINLEVNAIPVAKGPNGDWKIWPVMAWCHDYAVTKRFELLKLGWSVGSLRLAECHTSRNEAHCILLVEIDNKLFVLDNLRNEILPYDSTGYLWDLPIQSKENPDVWELWK